MMICDMYNDRLRIFKQLVFKSRKLRTCDRTKNVNNHNSTYAFQHPKPSNCCDLIFAMTPFLEKNNPTNTSRYTTSFLEGVMRGFYIVKSCINLATSKVGSRVSSTWLYFIPHIWVNKTFNAYNEMRHVDAATVLVLNFNPMK